VAAEFQIEYGFATGDRAYVVARIVDRSAAVVVTPTMTLGECAVEQWLEMPRSLDAAGRQRMDLFGFCLKTASDLGRLNVGDVVVLA
jgi:hypothetical protein